MEKSVEIDFSEREEVLRRGIDERSYLAARLSGATRREVLAADRLQLSLFEYAAARRQATHEEVIEAVAAGIDVLEYTTTRRGHNGRGAL